jgi:NAD(P)-dependent dehydrogenase (short-subunit alcohol dehydrogenase family)
MKIIIVGATGTIGKKLFAEFSKRHEVIAASYSKSEIKVDITSIDSIREMYNKIGPFDALISASGSAYFGSFDTMKEDDWYKGIKSKMMGQINLVMVGKELVSDNGSFTLTSGILASDPIRNGAALTVVNSAVNGFIIGASGEMKRNVRLNAVSPGVVEDSPTLFPAFPGHTPVKMDAVVRAYVKSVEGICRGQIINVV